MKGRTISSFRLCRAGLKAGVGALTIVALVGGCGSSGSPEAATASTQPTVTATVVPTVAVTPTVTVQATRTTSQPSATSSWAAETNAVTKNPLYAVGRIPASKCKEPSARPTSTARVRAYYTQTLACLNKAWAPVVREAGFRFSAPGLVVSAGRPSSSLCRLKDSAYYCNGVIYMDASFDIANYKTADRVWTRTTMAFVIAHEYGHHVQALTGILAASHARERSINGVDAPLQESRRLELQASCLSGVYQGADRTWFPVRGSWLQQWQFTVRNRGDEWNPQRDHGSKKNHGRWSLRGFGSADPGSCNTFTAAPSAVS